MFKGWEACSRRSGEVSPAGRARLVGGEAEQKGREQVGVGGQAETENRGGDWGAGGKGIGRETEEFIRGQSEAKGQRDPHRIVRATAQTGRSREASGDQKQVLLLMTVTTV